MAIEIRRMFEHLWWADQKIGTAIAEGTGSSQAREIYLHLVGTEIVWLDRIVGESQSVPVWPDLETDPSQLAERSARRWRDFLDSSEFRLDREIEYVNSAGHEFRTELRDILIHVALHGAYHRGQVSLSIRSGDAAPPPTDYIEFVRGAPAATRIDRRPE